MMASKESHAETLGSWLFNEYSNSCPTNILKINCIHHGSHRVPPAGPSPVNQAVKIVLFSESTSAAVILSN